MDKYTKSKMVGRVAKGPLKKDLLLITGIKDKLYYFAKPLKTKEQNHIILCNCLEFVDHEIDVTDKDVLDMQTIYSKLWFTDEQKWNNDTRTLTAITNEQNAWNCDGQNDDGSIPYSKLPLVMCNSVNSLKEHFPEYKEEYLKYLETLEEMILR